MLQKSFAKKSYLGLRWKNLLSPWQQVDWLLFGLIIGLTSFSGLVIYSVERNNPQLNHWLQQWVIGGVGTCIALTIARTRYEFLIQWRWLIYAITNLGLLAVIFLGTRTNGAQSWIDLGFLNLQPSEFAKLGIIITLAASLHKNPATKLTTVIKILAIVALPWVLIMLQPDLGTSLVFGAITLGMLYWANANPGWLLLLVSPIVSAILFNVYLPVWIFWAVAITVIAWFTMPFRTIAAALTMLINGGAGEISSIAWNLLKEYQKNRLTLFLNPEKDPLGGGYHLIQSRIAIGSGELSGRGLFHGTQTQLRFIPEQHTDFIFSAVGEEFGFIGCLLLLITLWLICMRLLYIACNAKENFGSLIAIGVLSMVAFQSVLNISMTIGIAPITGIPLPWLSYGGSSLLTNFLALGLVEAVANYSQNQRSW
jgi:rod shape determining protein RodA